MRYLSFLMLLLLNGNLMSQSDHGGGEYLWQPKDHITPEEDAYIKAQLRASVAVLEQQGKLKPARRNARVLFGWPLSYNGTDPGYYGISNYVDHNAAFSGSHNDSITDFDCGTRSYDLASGYNHRGTDIFTWPFSWNKMANDEVAVVAAAPGFIIFKQDGNPDTSCSFCTGCSWNAIYVRHDDGTVAWYGHLKTNSLTTKDVGNSVNVGEYLGIVGSSGSSTGPHLHFEVWENSTYTELIDPWVGPCNPTTDTTFWADQQPYRNSRINALTTGTASVDFGTCPDTAVTAIWSEFDPGQDIYFTAFYQDQIQGVSSIYRVYDPDGQLWDQWTHSSPMTYNASWWWWRRTLPVDAGIGEWTFEVRFAGNVETKAFYVGAMTSADNKPTVQPLRVHPNPFHSEIRITGPEAGERVGFTLLNVLGETLIDGESSGTIKSPDLPAGLYWLITRFNGTTQVHRIIRAGTSQ